MIRHSGDMDLHAEARAALIHEGHSVGLNTDAKGKLETIFGKTNVRHFMTSKYVARHMNF